MVTTSRQIFIHPLHSLQLMVLGSYKRKKSLKSSAGLKSFIPTHSPREREREETHTRVVKESSPEEEPLEMSLKKTMATLAVGCETARARKQL